MKSARKARDLAATAYRAAFYRKEKTMAILSAGINFGKPATEFIVESDESGVIQSCRNVVTGVEYVGGGGGGGDFSTAQMTVTESSTVGCPAIITVGDLTYIAIAPREYTAGVYDIVLYKGHAILGTEATVEGDAELIDADEGIWDVSGAITLLAAQ